MLLVHLIDTLTRQIVQILDYTTIIIFISKFHRTTQFKTLTIQSAYSSHTCTMQR